MQPNETDDFKKLIQELASLYKGTIYNDFFASAYWKVLRPYSLESISRACLDLLGNEVRKPMMPTPAELKMVARKFEPDKKPARVNQDEERWRRRYDYWQRGGYSDDALKTVFTMNDEELGVGSEGEDQFIACQHPGCETRVPWPSDDNVMHCPKHRSAPGRTVTRQEKLAMIETLTPKGRAYLRTTLEALMADIPITAEERQYHPPRWTDLPPKMAAYLETLDEATASRIVENFHTRAGEPVGM